VIRREGDGEAEVHDAQVDVIFVGDGTLVIKRCPSELW